MLPRMKYPATLFNEHEAEEFKIPFTEYNDLGIESISFSQQVNETISKYGFIVLENLPSHDDEFMKLLISTVGSPCQYENEGPMVMDVRPQKQMKSKNATSFYSWNTFDFHTDLTYIDVPPKYFAMACIQPDPNGGGLSILSDIQEALQLLDNEVIGELKKEQYTFTPPEHFQGNAIIKKSILRQDTSGNISLRVRFDRVNALTNNGKEALESLYDALVKTRIEFQLNGQSAYIADNWRLVHGRTAFTPRFDESDRHLRRIYATEK